MTTTELYAVYCQAYADYDLSPQVKSAIVAGSPIERAIAEFAVEDAANGVPLRSRESFAKAVAVGLAALAPLGLRAA